MNIEELVKLCTTSPETDCILADANAIRDKLAQFFQWARVVLNPKWPGVVALDIIPVTGLALPADVQLMYLVQVGGTDRDPAFSAATLSLIAKSHGWRYAITAILEVGRPEWRSNGDIAALVAALPEIEPPPSGEIKPTIPAEPDWDNQLQPGIYGVRTGDNSPMDATTWVSHNGKVWKKSSWIFLTTCWKQV